MLNPLKSTTVEETRETHEFEIVFYTEVVSKKSGSFLLMWLNEHTSVQWSVQPSCLCIKGDKYYLGYDPRKKGLVLANIDDDVPVLSMTSFCEQIQKRHPVKK